MDRVPAKLGMHAGNMPEVVTPKFIEHMKYDVLIIGVATCVNFKTHQVVNNLFDIILT